MQTQNTISNCTLIGNNAGMFVLPDTHHVIVIGDFKQSECKQYFSYDIDIRDDWSYFKTLDGKVLKKYIDSWKLTLPIINTGNLPDTRELMAQRYKILGDKILELQEYIKKTHLKNIEFFYKQK